MNRLPFHIALISFYRKVKRSMRIIVCISVMLLLLCSLPVNVTAGKIIVSLNFEKTSDDTAQILISVINKIKRLRTPVVDANISLSVSNSGEAETVLGNYTTNEAGEVLAVVYPLSTLFADTNIVHFVAVFHNDSISIKRNISISRANLKLEISDDNSGRYIHATVEGILEDGSFGPVEDAEVQFYVQRMFGLLPIGDAYSFTDENGKVSIEFPQDLPGGKTGNLRVIVRLEEHEYYGTLSKRTTVPWGIKNNIEELHPRELWSCGANVPIWLLVTVSSMLVGVWLTISYIVILLFKIKKASSKY